MMKAILMFLALTFLTSTTILSDDEIDELIAKGDQFYQNHDNRSALETYLTVLNKDSLNYEGLWKTSRAYIDIGETLKDDPRKEHFLKGEKVARKAVLLDSTGAYGHIYLSIALGRVALDAGAKKRIKLSKEIKKHADLAIKYDPEIDFAYHVLARWHRKISNLSWIEKSFANVFLGGVPKDASNEQAVDNFKKAISLNPNHINHHLELAKTYKMMKKKEEAVKELQICLDLPVSDSDDPQYKEEAKELLEDLK
jgi:tetratricopeptide (TPR) repeat protein